MRIGDQQEFRDTPSDVTVHALGLNMMEDPPVQQKTGGEVVNPFVVIIPLLTTLPGSFNQSEKADAKSSRYLVAMSLPMLPSKFVGKVWNRDYVDMEEFLPAPCSLRIAEQGNSPPLQDSLVSKRPSARLSTSIHGFAASHCSSQCSPRKWCQAW